MQHNDNKQIVSAIIIAGVLIAGAILLKGSSPSNTNTANTNGQKDYSNVQIKPVTSDDHIFGNQNAKIVIVEYSDLECPFCKVFHETMQKVTKERPDVAWVYRHYPIAQLHPKAHHEAEAAECAWEQGGNTMFWKYIDRIFAITPSNNKLDEKELMNTADYLGLNSSIFYTCLQSGKYSSKIDADMADGNKGGVNGTPSSYILVKGKIIDQIPGAQPYESVMQRLNAIK